MALATPDEYDALALIELEAAATIADPTEKKQRLNQASALATLAELARERPTRAAQVGNTASVPTMLKMAT